MADTRFKPGNKYGKGRPRKPEWLTGKGEEALKKVYEIMNDENSKAEIVVQCAKLIAEYSIGKPKQVLDVDATTTIKNEMSYDEKIEAINRIRGTE